MSAYEEVPNKLLVILPKTLILPVWIIDPVLKKEPLKIIVSALVDNRVVPVSPCIEVEPVTCNEPEILTAVLNKLPVNDWAVTLFVTVMEFRLASEPDTMTFFQFGMFFY